jgi:hypothetical protein
MLNNTHRTPLRYNISDFFSSLLDINIGFSRTGPDVRHLRSYLFHSLVRDAHALLNGQQMFRLLKPDKPHPQHFVCSIGAWRVRIACGFFSWSRPAVLP